MCDAEDLTARFELAPSSGNDRRLVVLHITGLAGLVAISELTVGAGHENGPDTLPRVSGKDAPRARRLVIRVRMDCHKGKCGFAHRCPFIDLRPSSPLGVPPRPWTYSEPNSRSGCRPRCTTDNRVHESVVNRPARKWGQTQLSTRNPSRETTVNRSQLYVLSQPGRARLEAHGTAMGVRQPQRTSFLAPAPLRAEDPVAA